MKTDDWKHVKMLLHSGYAFLDALQILGKDVTEIKVRLEEGQTIENVILKNQNGRFYEHLRFFIQIGSLEHAIDSALHFYEFEKNLKTKWIKQAAYPIFIFVSAFILLLIFSSYLVPMMLESFQENDKFLFYIWISKTIRLICIVCIIICLILLLFAWYFYHHKQDMIYLILQSSRLKRITSLFTSFLFAGYLLELIHQGVPTYTALQFLENVSEETIFSVLQRRIMHRLEQGTDMLSAIEQESLIHDTCKQSFRIGISTNSLQSMLAVYLKQQELEWGRRLKKSALGIQCVSYIFVGIVVLLVYQIMLIPLSMLEQM